MKEIFLQDFSTEDRVAGSGVQVMPEILMPLPTYFLCLFADIKTVLIIHFGLVLQRTKQVFRRDEELKSELLKEYLEEYLSYLAEKVGVRSMERGKLCVTY